MANPKDFAAERTMALQRQMEEHADIIGSKEKEIRELVIVNAAKTMRRKTEIFSPEEEMCRIMRDSVREIYDSIISFLRIEQERLST